MTDSHHHLQIKVPEQQEYDETDTNECQNHV